VLKADCTELQLDSGRILSIPHTHGDARNP